ncbi:hypothetical protein KCP77_03195 [Salmonella enterica subsp. enterica]|nr:hypothetical protein KCP77_03195 [Salmonella enterica subsp. enterica]
MRNITGIRMDKKQGLLLQRQTRNNDGISVLRLATTLSINTCIPASYPGGNALNFATMRNTSRHPQRVYGGVWQ